MFQLRIVKSSLDSKHFATKRNHETVSQDAHARNEGCKVEQVFGRGITLGALKSPSDITSTFFNTVNLLPKDLRFEHGGAKLAPCPGRRLASLRLAFRRL